MEISHFRPKSKILNVFIKQKVQNSVVQAYIKNPIIRRFFSLQGVCHLSICSTCFSPGLKLAFFACKAG